MASFFRLEVLMDNNSIYEKIEQYRNKLYENNAESFGYLPRFVESVQTLVKNNKIQVLNWNEFITMVSDSYYSQSVIGVGDIISRLLLNENIDSYNNIKIDSKYCKINKNNIPEIKKDIYKSFYEIEENEITDDNIIIDINGNVAVNTADGIVYLNSIIHNHNAEKSWTKQFNSIKYYNFVIIYGMANNEYIRYIIKNIDEEIPIMIYEPNENIFKYNFTYSDMRELLCKDNLYYIVEGINEGYIKDVVDSYINYTNMDKIIFYCSPGYDVLYANNVNKLERACKDILTDIRLNDNSIIKWSSLAIQNTLLNMKYMIDGTDIYRVKRQLNKINISDIPAIIVAAGPSLDKNIDYLKYAKGRAFILAVDSSIRMMLKHNILPDSFVTLDPNKERVLFENDKINDVPFFYNTCSTHDVLEKNRSIRILYNHSWYIHESLNLLGRKNDVISVGGSVACAAFSIARYLGFKNIIVIGQDLAFTDNKKHASIVYDETPVSETERDSYTTIEGANGEELLTYINFKAYRNWYENYIVHDPELNMINATEGGALIHGAEHISLKKAIDKYCNLKFDFKKCIENVELLFDKQETSKIINLIKENIINCDKLENMFDQCIRLYKLICNNIDEKQKNIYIDDINKIIKRIDTYHEMNLVESYTRLAEINELHNIYDEKNILWNDITQKGINLCNSNIEAIKKVQKIFDEGIKNIEEKYTDI